MISVRGGAGLGDAIYIQSIVRHFVEQGHKVEVCTAWPDVFRPLDGKVVYSAFRRKPIDKLAHYATRRGAVGTTQFEDACITAGITKPIDLRIDWNPVSVSLVQKLTASGKPVVVVQMPRAPFGRTDGKYTEFLPDCRRVQQAIDALRGLAFLVQVGKGEPSYRYSGIDLDLRDATNVTDVIDIGYVADAFLGQCSFIIPLAESFRKPALLVWSRRGLKSQHEVIRQMTPKKILHRETSRHVVDDCNDQELREAVDALLEKVRRPALV